MQEVVKQLSERLALLGHDVTVIARKQPERDFKEKNGVKIIDFEISGNLVNGIKGEKEKYKQFLLNNENYKNKLWYFLIIIFITGYFLFY